LGPKALASQKIKVVNLPGGDLACRLLALIKKQRLSRDGYAE